MNKSTFKAFTPSKTRGGVFISISKNIFGLSTDFVMENTLSEMTKVVLYYDKEQKIIAFKFLKNKDKDAYSFKVSTVQNSESKTIGAESFYLHHSIDLQIHKGRYRPYITTLPNLGLVYYIKLKKENHLLD